MIVAMLVTCTRSRAQRISWFRIFTRRELTNATGVNISLTHSTIEDNSHNQISCTSCLRIDSLTRLYRMTQISPLLSCPPLRFNASSVLDKSTSLSTRTNTAVSRSGRSTIEMPPAVSSSRRSCSGKLLRNEER